MLKKTILLTTTLIASQLSLAVTTDALHLSGQWICSGYDMHDGPYTHGNLALTVDAKDSDFAHNYGAYKVKLVETDGTTYIGEAAANGNTTAVYFENTDATASSDRGVGIATITHNADQHNKITTVLNKFYYEPSYQGGGNGLETCIKQD